MNPQCGVTLPIGVKEHLWDYNFDPQTSVVEARMSRLRDKIDRGFQGQLIVTVGG
jgi:two-component system, OmpR family, response regulator